MPQLIRPLLILLFLVSSLLIETTLAQNCALPALVNLAEDSSRTECAPEGTILAELATKNILNLTGVKDNPLLPDYLNIILLEDKLILKVKTPLCEQREALNSSETDSPLTYVDSSWNANAEIEAEFLCMDGRPKVVKFFIPLNDENTQAPAFEHPLYALVTEPCTTGTHLGYCPLNFEVPIYVTDGDRDEKNALCSFFTDKGDLIQVSGGIPESNSADAKLDRSLTSHRMSVHLYLKDQQEFQIDQVISFQLTAYNTRNSPTGKKLFAQTNITVTFGFGIPPDDCVHLRSPTFINSVFHATVINNYESVEGKLLEGIKPTGISAAIEPSARRSAYGDSEEEADSSLVIRYAMKGRSVFEIDRVDGSVYFIEDIHDSLWGTIETFEVVAYVESYDFLNVTVPLVVHFQDAPAIACPSPSEPTVEPPTTCSDCSTTCPSFNTTCPTSPTTPATTPEYSTTSEGPSDPEMTTEDSGHTTQWPTETTTTEGGTERPSTTDIPASTSLPPTTTTPASTTHSITTSPVTNAPTMPTSPTTGSPSTEPTDIPSTDPTDIPSTDPTGIPTTESTTGIPTTPATGIPTTETTGIPTTESTTGIPTTESTTGIPTTESTTGIPTTESTTGIPTTPATGIPTTETTGIPTTPTTGIPTTPATGIPTTPATGIPTNPTTGIPTTPATGIPTTPETTTTQHTTTPVETTTTLSTTTPNPGCCDQCWKSKFECPADTSDANKKYPDPVNCSTYHQCLPDGLGGTNIVSFECPSNLTFCKKTQLCGYNYDCECGDDTELDQKGCEDIDCFRDCNACFNSTHPENKCSAEGLFPDEVYADIFHNCRKSDDWDPTEGFIDCPQRCYYGLVFCPDLEVCGWGYEDDSCRTNKPKSRCHDCSQASNVQAFLQLIKQHFGPKP